MMVALEKRRLLRDTSLENSGNSVNVSNQHAQYVLKLLEDKNLIILNFNHDYYSYNWC